MRLQSEGHYWARNRPGSASKREQNRPRVFGDILGPVIRSYIKNGTWARVGAILYTRLPEVLSRLHSSYNEEAVRYWTRRTEIQDDDEADAEEEALINRQAQNQEGQVEVNHTQEDGSEDQEERRREKITEAKRRRRKKLKRWVARRRE
jgi:hypothetical protein